MQGPVGLGHRRLSVIDLSERGHQPMSSEDHSSWIVFNGEIYNYEILRRDLIARGYRFRSNTDTEVLVNLYVEYGTECLTRLRGMFAFGIWDANLRRLLLARDPLGKKPLFYYRDRRTFRFASEPKGILSDASVDRTADMAALHIYFSLGFVPHPRSAFVGMSKLPPASWLTIGLDGDFQVGRFWQPRFEPKIAADRPQLEEQLRTHVDTAVRRRLIGDVPIGVLLSGGIDSSVVVAAARRVATGRLKTFSVGFDVADYDELRFSRLIAEKFSTDHEEIVVSEGIADLLPRLAQAYGEPFADSSAVPSLKICEVARRSVTVVLNGDGGDEAFGGYDRYRAAAAAARFDRLPYGVRRLLRDSSRFLPAARSKSLWTRVQRFLHGTTLPPGRRYAFWMSVFDADERKALYTADFAEEIRSIDPESMFDRAFDEADISHPFDRANRLDFDLYLPGDLLVKMDLASMSYSLEARSPFLDQDLVDFGVALPIHYKFRGASGKWLLKQTFASELPPEILSRRKMGFAVPLDKWFAGPLRDLASDVLLGDTARQRGIVRPSTSLEFSMSTSRAADSIMRGCGVS